MANEVHDLRSGWKLREAVKNALPPVMTSRPAPCQEMILPFNAAPTTLIFST